jgi:hypothetical protein
VRDEAVSSGEKDINALVSKVVVREGSFRNNSTCGNRSERRTGGATIGSMPAVISRVRTPSPIPSTYIPTTNVPSLAASSSATFADRETA